MEIGFENTTRVNSRVVTDYPSRARVFNRGMCGVRVVMFCRLLLVRLSFFFGHCINCL